MELGGQVLHTGIVHHKSNLTEREFIVVDHPFDPLNLLKNDVTFKGYRFIRMEKF